MKAGLIICATPCPVHALRCITTICIDISQRISTSANHTIYDLIFSSSFAGAFLLITALLSHMLVISLMAFAGVLVYIVVKSLGANF